MQKRWKINSIQDLFETPFLELIQKATEVHRKHFEPNTVQISTLLSIKTGACPEDCSYCPQSGHFETNLKNEKLMEVREVIEKAKMAKENGASRFCMGAAYRSPPQQVMPKLIAMIEAVKNIGMETCMTLGMLTENQAQALKQAGLDFYNHNIDTSKQYYTKIIKTRTFQDRLETINHLRTAQIKVCTGGIIGMGETRSDRIHFLHELQSLTPHPESVPINRLIRIKGTPLFESQDIDAIEFIRTIAVARVILPKSKIRLSAGRSSLTEEQQILCFLAGANSIHFGEKLLTTNNCDMNADQKLFKKLKIKTC